MLAQHLHHPAIWRHMVVARQYLLDETAILDLEDAAEAVGIGLIGTEDAEILLLLVLCIDIAQHAPELAGRFVALAARLFHRNGIARKIWNVEVYHELAAVGMWVGSHTPLALGGQLS